MKNVKPRVSIILPIRNEGENIKDTIDSILKQNYDISKLEIIAVDGNSIDNTKKIIDRYDKQIKLLENPDKYMSAGFNIGLSEANGSIIIMMGGHCILDKDYVKNCVTKLLNSEFSCVGGIIQNKSINSKQEAISLALSSDFGVGGVSFRKKKSVGKYVDTVAFGAYKREVFNNIGALDEELIKNQDDEFNFRLLQSGSSIWLDPSIISIYQPRGSLRKLFFQYFKYGFYKVRVIQKRKGIPAWRHLIPGLFIITLVTALIFGALTNSFWFFLLIMSIYFLINLVFSIWTARQKLNTIYLLPIVFFILHISYGMGFLCGLVYFWNKYQDRKVKDHHFNRDQFIETSRKPLNSGDIN